MNIPSFDLLPSGSVRLYVRINRKRFRISTPYKAKRIEENRAVGKGSNSVNRHLDRIEEEITDFIYANPVHTFTSPRIKEHLKRIINDTRNQDKRKLIPEYFEDFLKEKQLEVNPKTKQKIKPSAIVSHRTEFKKFMAFDWELEEVTKANYNIFLEAQLQEHSPNTVGKTIRRLKTFFNWCHSNGLPISPEFKKWTPISEETEIETRALNLEQFTKLAELVIDPVEVYTLAKDSGKVLDAGQVNELVTSLDTVRKHFLAMGSLGLHKGDFYALKKEHIFGNLVKFRRSKNHQGFVCPFRGYAKEFAGKGTYLYEPRIYNFHKYTPYLEKLADLPFHITAKTFRKTFGSIIWYEIEAPVQAKQSTIMKAYAHKSWNTTCKYLGIQDADMEKQHELLGL